VVAVSFAIPKSRIFARPSRVRKMFSGLRSRWMIPFSCAAALRHLQRRVDRAPRRERPAREPVAQRLALQQLADDVRPAGVASDVVDREQVGMVEHPDGARFLLEALQRLRVVGPDVGQHLDRDVAPEARVGGAIHHTHTAFADRTGNTVRPEHRLWLEGHGVGE
jgi:hypothetical protein